MKDEIMEFSKEKLKTITVVVTVVVIIFGVSDYWLATKQQTNSVEPNSTATSRGNAVLPEEPEEPPVLTSDNTQNNQISTQVSLPPYTLKNYDVVYSAYNEEKEQYEVYLHDIETGTEKTMYSFRWKKNFAAPVIRKYDDRTIMIDFDRGGLQEYFPEGHSSTFLVDLNGNKVSGKFVPPSSYFYFSPDRSKLVYYTNPPKITVRDMASGKEFFVKRTCSNASWSNDSSMIYCSLDDRSASPILAINTSNGIDEILEVVADRTIAGGNGYYSDNNLAFETKCHGQVDRVPPCSITMTNTKTNQVRTLISRQDKYVIFVTLTPKGLVFILDDKIYLANVVDVENTMKKIADGRRVISFSPDGMNLAYEISEKVSQNPLKITDTIFITDITGSTIVKLHTHIRASVSGPQFVGWY